MRQGELDPDLAYTAGLLCNFGYLVLDAHLVDCAAELDARRAAGDYESQAERAVLGIDHARVAGRMMRRWEFPELLVDAVEHHHEPGRASLDPALCAVVGLAERLADAVEAGEDLRALEDPAGEEVFRLTGLDPTSLRGYEVALQLEMERARALAMAAG